MDDLLPLADDPAAAGQAKDELPGALTERTVHGSVGSVVYTSADGQYLVLRATDRGGREFTLVGPLGGLAPGEDFEAVGVWETHKEYGRQFRVNRFKAVLPSTAAGLERYLASGILPGIGEKLAARIVAKFGGETLTVLDQYSARLREVPGLGRQRLEQVRQAWRQQSAQRAQDIYLQSLGLSAAYCRRVNRHFETKAPDVIRTNPYRLTEVRGIGFRMADVVAQRLGLAPDHPARLAAGCLYTMQELAERGGHCCAQPDFLTARAAEALAVEPAAAARGLAHALETGELVRDLDLIYPRDLHRDECRLAALVHARAAHRPAGAPAELPVSDQWPKLNAEQRQAVRQAFRHPLSVITGGPGVGKTTVTREIVHVARQLKLTVALAAPTGRAAKRLSESCGTAAVTLHRLLKWEPERNCFHYDGHRPLPVDLLIVDEVSMVDLPLAVALFDALAPATRLILVGDRDQLPSVGPGRVLGDLIESQLVPVQNLCEIFRQAAGSQIIVNAHHVNAGRVPDLRRPGGDAAADFYWIEQDDPEKVVDVVRKLVGERIPQKFGLAPLTDIQVLTPMNRGICGARHLNAVLKQDLNPAAADQPTVTVGDYVFSPGDRVMQRCNNYELGVFNGEQGLVTQVDPGAGLFAVRFDDRAVAYSPADLDQLSLAYAITVHKSQGSEFPAVVITLLTSHYVMLQRNLVYTAMTRASRLLVMIGADKALGMAVRNFNKSPRLTRLLARLKPTP